MIRRPLLLLAAALAPAALPAQQPSATEVVAAVTAGVRRGAGDSLTRVWARRTADAPNDRLALLARATLARLLYDYPRADSLHARLARGDTTDAIAVEAMLGYARSLEARNAVAAAIAEYDRARRAARRLDEPVLEADILTSRSILQLRASGPQVALASLDSADRLLGRVEGAPLALEADIRRRRVMVTSWLGDTNAIANGERAVALAKRSGDPVVQGDAYRALGYALGTVGRDDSALTVVRTAESYYEQGRATHLLAATRIVRAGSHVNRGELGDAMAAARLALVEGRAAHAELAVGAALTSLGAIAVRTGDLAAADRYLRQADSLYRAVGDSANLGLVRGQLTLVALGTGDTTRARTLATEGLAFNRRIGDRQEETEVLRQLASIALRRGDLDDADRWLAAARRVATRYRQDVYVERLELEAALIAMRRGTLARAEQSLRRFLRVLDTAQHVLRHDARVRLADVQARRGDLAAAMSELATADGEIDRWRERLSEGELRVLAFEASASDAGDRGESFARVIAALTAAGHASEAFAFAERRRARMLNDAVRRREALVASRGTPVVEGTVARVEAPAVTAIPDDRTAIVEYVVGPAGAPTSALVATRAGVQGHVLPPADSLAGPIDRWRVVLESGTPSPGAARALGASLLDQVVTNLPSAVTHLIVVPDGVLHRVPFDALGLADGRVGVERFTFATAPSAAIFLQLRGRPSRNGIDAPRLLAFGDPAFGGRDAASRGDDAVPSAPAIGRLPGSGREVRLVADFFRTAEVRTGAEATAEYLRTIALTPYRVLHFATHAFVDESSPVRTTLALAPSDGDDGFVSPGEIERLRLDADLVVLSACRSAGGRVVGGEGVLGLTAPFLGAGARAVVATNWQISDRGTLPFVRAFYEALADSLPAADALRAAKLDAIRRGAPANEWGAFTIIGDPAVRISLMRRSRGRARWLFPAAVTVLALAVLLLLGGFAIRRRAGATS